MRKLLACACLSLALLSGNVARCEAKEISAAFDDFLVRVTTGFSGKQILLFGAVDAPGDVVVVVSGPLSEVQVRKKSRIAGIWIDTEHATFDGVPGFYSIASSKPLDEILTPTVLANRHIGVGRLGLVPKTLLSDLPDYQTALFRIKQREGLFTQRVGHVTFIDDRLFSVNISLPSSVPTGTFKIDVFLVRDGDIVDAQPLNLFVSKIGFGADIYDFAHRHSYAYGAIAVLVALMAGWVAHLAFRRR